MLSIHIVMLRLKKMRAVLAGIVARRCDMMVENYDYRDGMIIPPTRRRALASAGGSGHVMLQKWILPSGHLQLLVGVLA
jgi:hypothetical protein